MSSLDLENLPFAVFTAEYTSVDTAYVSGMG